MKPSINSLLATVRILIGVIVGRTKNDKGTGSIRTILERLITISVKLLSVDLQKDLVLLI